MDSKLIYEDSTISLLKLFNFSKNLLEEIEENVNNDIDESCSYDMRNFNVPKEIDNEMRNYYMDNIEYKSIVEFVFSKIEHWFNDNVSNLFEENEEVEIKIHETNYDMVKYELIVKDKDILKKNIGKGMNAYGLFEWNLHSDEDKNRFVEDGWLALRELLHYYEACCSKPRINLGSGRLWSLKISFDDLHKKGNQLLKERNENS